MYLCRNIAKTILLEPVMNNNQGKNEQTNARKAAHVTKHFLLHKLSTRLPLLFCR
jgi:hypothetical protein